jgi:hypothetical protein
LFWQPPLKNGEDVDPEKAQFLPLGFDEFFGKEVIVKKESIWMRLVLAVENAWKPLFEKLEKWTEEKKKAGKMKMELIEKELELIEAELCLEETIEDMDEDLKMREKEEEKKVEMGLQEEEDTSALANQDDERSAVEKEAVEEGEEEEEEEEEEEDVEPSSFGSVTADQDTGRNGQKGKKPGEPPFSTSSLSFASSSLVSGVSSNFSRYYFLLLIAKLF